MRFGKKEIHETERWPRAESARARVQVPASMSRAHNHLHVILASGTQVWRLLASVTGDFSPDEEILNRRQIEST